MKTQEQEKKPIEIEELIKNLESWLTFGVHPDDLENYEKQLLEKFLGPDWKKKWLNKNY